MVKRISLLFILLFLFASSEELPKATPWTGAPMKLDGKLDEAAWKTGAVFGGFVPVEAEGRQKAEVQTSFMVHYDAEYLYVGVECEEPRMKDLAENVPLWIGDGVELFFAPSGQDAEYYQFRVNAKGPTFAMFYAESGNIRPDKYSPFWERAVDLRADGWSIEMRLPWHAFYMSSARTWSETWRVNVARNRRLARQDSSWSLLRDDFNAPQRFRFMTGFPQKTAEQDVSIRSAKANIETLEKGVYKGRLELELQSARAGVYELECKEPAYKGTVAVNEGITRHTIPVVLSFPKQGKQQLAFSLHKGGKCYAARTYEVDIAYEPLKVRLSTPGYRNNFYPGQDSSRIAGQVAVGVAGAEKVAVSLDGGAARPFPVVNGVAQFSIDTPRLADGDHKLEFTLLGTEQQPVAIKVRKFSKAPEGIRTTWIENGHLVVDGKPVLPRMLFAHYYHGGEAMREKTDADDLGLTGTDAENRIVVTCDRLVPGTEAKEGCQDVRPSQKLLDKLAAVVKNPPKKQFLYYYLSDEPECRNISPVFLKYQYDHLAELDPWHVIMVSTRAPKAYLECLDASTVHPYFGPTFDGKGGRYLNVPLHRIREYVESISSLGRPDKMVGLTGQFFSYKMNSIYADYPRFDELEVQVWTAAAHGARWYNSYAYHDIGDRAVLYEGHRFLMKSIAALEPFFLLGKELPVTAVDPENMLDARLYEWNGQYMLLLVNLKEASMATSVASPVLAKVKDWHYFRMGEMRQGNAGKLAFELKPYECVILTSIPMDAGLPTRSQTLERIAELEKERLSRPNILLEKGRNIEINTSNQPRSILNMQNKLFDGTRDVWVWEHYNTKQAPFIELSFPKKSLIPKFSKLRIYGYPLNKDIRISIRKAGEWMVLTPTSVNSSKYCVEFTYPQQFRTIKLRMDFPISNQRLELYEVEME